MDTMAVDSYSNHGTNLYLSFFCTNVLCTGFVTGQSPTQQTLPNIYKQHLESEI